MGITLHARIFAVADCFDALSSDRPYRPGMSLKRVMQILQEGAGVQFDPRVLEVFPNDYGARDRATGMRKSAGAVVEDS